MAYIGRQLARGENKLFDDISSSFNGSTTTFNLTVSSVATATATPYQLFVSLGGVMQKPNTDFTTAGNQITFTTAPAAGLSCWIMMQGDTIDQAAIPDASVSPSKIAGSGDFAFPADIRLKDADGSHYVGFQAPTTVSTNKVWTLPAADGSASQYLQTNGSGVLSWATVSIGGATGIDFNDNVKTRWGTGTDLEIYHDGSHSYIDDTGTGNLKIKSNKTVIQSAAGEDCIVANENGAVELFHDNSKKFETTSTGVSITGALTVSTNATITGNLTVSGTTTTINTQTLDVEDKNVVIGKVSSPSDTTADGGGWTLKGATDKTFNWVNATDAWTSSEHIHLIDNKKLLVGGASGTVDGLEIVHNGSNSILNDSGTGTLQLQLGGSTKLEIQSGGINVTGAISVNGAALASGNTFTAVADGALSNNKPVVVTTAGKVKEVKETPTVLSTPTQNSQSDHGPEYDNNIRWLGAAYGRTHSTEFLVYVDYNNDTDMALLQPSGTNLATITKTSTTLTTEKWYYLDAAYDVDNNKYGIIGTDQGSGNYPKFAFASSSSSSNLTAGSAQTLRSGNGGSGEHFPRICYCGSGRFAVLYTDYSTSETVYVRILTWNGSNNYTAGTEVAVHTYCKGACIAYHANSGKLIIAYREEQQGNDTVAVVGTISGSGGSATVTLSSEVQVNGSDTGRGGQIIVDDSTNKIVYCGRSDNGNTFQSVVMSLSGTTLTAGSPVTITSSALYTQDDYHPHLSYIDKANKVLINYTRSNETSSEFREGTVSTSSNTITWSAARSWGTGDQNRYTKMVPLYGDSLGRVLRNHGWNSGGSYKGKTQGMTYIENVSSLDTQDGYVGYPDAAYSDGQTATIKSYGNIVTTLSGLTPGSNYFVQSDGSVATTYDSSNPALVANTPCAGKAITSTSLLIRDPKAAT